jgi:rhodanese-related sulfurtransferase
MGQMSSPVPELTVADVGEDAYLLDVRDADEWAAGHAPQAHHLPMTELLGRLDELPSDRDVVVVCRVGARSAQVVAYLQAHGWTRVSNLAGGMWAWQAAGKSMVNDGGGAAYVL